MKKTVRIFGTAVLISLLIGAMMGPLFAQEVGIGTTSPAARMDVQAPATYTGDLFRVLRGTNTYVIVKNGGNVGIGTANPAYKLHLYGTSNNAADVYSQTDAARIVKHWFVNGGRSWSVGQTGTTSVPHYAFRITDETGGTARLTITTDGNVGIGSTNPAYRLHVANDGMIYAEGTFGSGAIVPSGAKVAFIWNPRKAAIRAGEVAGGVYSNRWDNSNMGDYSVALGFNNMASALGAVSNGYQNTASNNFTTVAGGEFNSASGYISTISGGNGNTASGYGSTVSGGGGNTASGNYTTISGGYQNTASDLYGTISGGYDNTASNTYSTVGGGYQNTASGNQATVGGGQQDTASGQHSTVSGGYQNVASGQYSTVSGGGNNAASGAGSTIGGGLQNTASGYVSTVSGGWNNTAGGDYSWAGGRGMKLGFTADRTFVWGYDASTTPPTITTSDAFLIGPSGNAINVGIGTPTPNRALVVEDTSSGTNLVSLRNHDNGGYTSIDFFDDAGTMRMSVGYANTGTTDPYTGDAYVHAHWGADLDLSVSSPTANIIFRTNSYTERMRITSGGNVGIGTNAPAYLLHVNGDAAKPGGGSWTNPSDRRLKDIYGPYNKGLQEILQLRPVRFSYKKDNPRHLPSDEVYAGFVAQEVQTVFPECVEQGADGYLDFNMSAITVAVINAIQQQQALIRALEEENRKLKEEGRMLKEENAVLRNTVGALQQTVQSLDARMKYIETRTSGR